MDEIIRFLILSKINTILEQFFFLQTVFLQNKLNNYNSIKLIPILALSLFNNINELKIIEKFKFI